MGLMFDKQQGNAEGNIIYFLSKSPKDFVKANDGTILKMSQPLTPWIIDSSRLSKTK